MDVKLYKWSGAGNLFVVADGRGADVEGLRSRQAIVRICGQYGTDGLMILNSPAEAGTDFDMEFYNPDGSGGMMCGNGGRCIVAFADYLGIRPGNGEKFVFTAPDGLHDAEILSARGNVWTVRLKMTDAAAPKEVLDGWFINTGTRHFVKFVKDVEEVDVPQEGREIRLNVEFKPEGTNVNFVQVLKDGSLKVRTFEKGVEGETAACGTGLTASALVAFHTGRESSSPVILHARQNDLKVDFIPGDGFSEVHLTGPAELLETER